MYVFQADTAVYGEIVHSLLALLYQCVAEQLPGQFLGPAAYLLHRLVHGHCAYGYGAVADDPLAGLVDIVSGGEVHKGVSAPFAAPYGLLYLFLDGRGGGGVADIGVDLHEEVPAYDHRLCLGMVDVGREGCPSGCYLVAHEFGGDMGLNAQGLAVHVLADGHVFHLRGDDTLFGVVHLGYLRALPGPVGQTDVLEAQMVKRLVGQTLASVFGRDLRQLLHLTLQDPLLAEPWQAAAQVNVRRRVAVRSAGVVDVDGRVLCHDLLPVLYSHGGGEAYFPHAHFHVRMERALHVDFLRVRISDSDVVVVHIEVKLFSFRCALIPMSPRRRQP